MAAMLSDHTELAAVDQDDGTSIVVDGPDGSSYSVGIPAAASADEVAAIAASVSAALATAGTDEVGHTETIDPWTWIGRAAATGSRDPPSGSADAWRLAGRADLL